MTPEQFFARYDAMSFDERNEIISTLELGQFTWTDMLNQLKSLEQKIVPIKLAQQEYLTIAAKILYKWG